MDYDGLLNRLRQYDVTARPARGMSGDYGHADKFARFLGESKYGMQEGLPPERLPSPDEPGPPPMRLPSPDGHASPEWLEYLDYSRGLDHSRYRPYGVNPY